MSRFTIIVLTIILLLFMVIGGFFFKLRPQYVGNIAEMPVTDTTEVLFDEYGIPHIYAANAHDAYVSLGYVHAQERLWQMELLRRVGGGRLSEVLGAPTLKADVLFRTLGIPQKAAFTAARLESDKDKEWYKATEAYLEGVNKFMDEGPTPLEFRALEIEKEHFTIYDLHLISGYMSYSFGQALTVDPLMTSIRDELGTDYLDDLHMDYEPGSRRIPVFPRIQNEKDNEEEDEEDYASALRDLPLPLLYGSNSWVVGKKNTENGSVLFANDTHIGYSQPCTWYEAHIEYPGHSFYGNHLAGIPFGLIGHSRDMAWGITMFLNDDMDLYCEKLSPDGKSYLYNGEYRPMTVREEVIHIKGQQDTTISVSHTHHGPMVTNVVEDLGKGDEVSCQWTYLDLETNLIEAFYTLGHSTNIDEARGAVSLIAAPGLNITYGNANGDIAAWAAARLPNRPVNVDPVYLLDGTTAADESFGYQPFEKNPHIENPPWGYVYSANNEHQTIDGKKIFGYYEPDNRASRISQKLAARVDWNMEAMKKLITDTYSIDDKRLAKDIIYLMGNIKELDLTENEADALRQIKEWDGEQDVDELGPAVFNRWVYHILQSAMADELGAERFKKLLETNIIKSSIKEIICNQESPWWDNVNTEDDLENRQMILMKALSKAVKEMEEFYGSDVAQWTWGRQHQTLFGHVFKDQPILGDMLNVGPFPAPGGVETINNAYYPLSNEEVIYSHHGPQMRILLDFSDVDGSLSILPTGQSGVVTSPHYDDQAEMYIRGAFRPQLMNRKEIEEQSTTLLLLPKE